MDQDQKWNSIPSILTELNLLQKQQISNPFILAKINEVSQKLTRIRSLKEKIDVDGEKLKLEYLVLMRERNLYFEKLKGIQNVGDQNDWKDQEGLMEGIREILFNFGKKEEK